MNIKQLKIGAIISYTLIAVNSIYGIIITPYILGIIGVSEYGVYKIITSFAGSLTVLNLGIGSTVIRYIAKFNSENDKGRIENFSAMSIIQVTVISLIIFAISIVMYNLIGAMYSNSLTEPEISRARQLFIIFVLALCLHIFENVFFGIISGCNRFVFGNSVMLSKVLIRIMLIYVILPFWSNSLTLVGIDLMITILSIGIGVIYIKKGLLIEIKYRFWDKMLFLDSFKYTSLSFIQSIVVQFNGNVDNIVIGATLGASTVAVYSIGLQLSNMLEQFAISLSSLMLPTVTDQITAGASNRELEDTVIKVGRLQFTLIGAVLIAFIMVGREFILLWLGNGYEGAWLIAILIMVPTSIELIQNVCLSIIRAKNKLVFRTWTVALMATVNLLITVIGVKIYGYVAAAVGTTISLFFGNFLAMNIYYYRVMKLDVFRIFFRVIERTTLCLLVSSIFLFIMNIYVYGSWKAFLMKIIVFLLIYILMMIKFGFNKKEKQFLRYFLKNRRSTIE